MFQVLPSHPSLGQVGKCKTLSRSPSFESNPWSGSPSHLGFSPSIVSGTKGKSNMLAPTPTPDANRYGPQRNELRPTLPWNTIDRVLSPSRLFPIKDLQKITELFHEAFGVQDGRGDRIGKSAWHQIFSNSSRTFHDIFWGASIDLWTLSSDFFLIASDMKGAWTWVRR